MFVILIRESNDYFKLYYLKKLSKSSKTSLKYSISLHFEFALLSNFSSNKLKNFTLD